MKRSQSVGRWPLALLPLIVVLCSSCGTSAPSASPSGPTESPGATPGRSSSAATPTPGSTAPATPSGSAAPPLIPEPPHAAASPPGTIDEQAAALAAAVSVGGQEALAPLLTAYHTAGLPIIGFAGEPLVGDPEDPSGLPYWMVWLSAGAKPDFRLSLADATKLLVAMEDPIELDTAAAGAALLADLREMATASDDYERFFAHFVAGLAAQAGVDPLDVAATPDTVMLDSVALTFVMAAVLRGVVIDVVSQDPDSFAARAQPIAAIGPFDPVPPPGSVRQAASPCNFQGIPDHISFWLQWVASRAAAGIQLPGMQQATRSLVSLITGQGTALTGRIGSIAGWVSSVLNALGLVIQLTHIDVDILLDPEPLERTKSSRQDGQESTLTAKLFFDLEGSSLDGGQGVGNCLAILLNAFGIQTSLPSNGPIPGATVIFEGKAGFNQGLGSGGFVQFPNQAQMRQDTNQAGEVQIQVQGIRQRPRDKPRWAPEWIREASVHIHSTTGAVNERNIATMFINGLTATTAGPAGALGAIADVLATVRWDVGERVFRVKDWLEAWYIDQQGATSVGTSRIKGQKCEGADGKWQPVGEYEGLGAQSNGQNWNIDITMSSDTSGQGTFIYSDVQILTPVPGITVTTIGTAEGNVTISIHPDTGVATLDLVETKHTYRSTTNQGGQGSEVNAPLQSYTQVWQPGDPNDICSQPVGP